ncbi:hypothetical protein DXG01_008402 [Tephrocybe rancida]|nr:hypothetical protein DXG01_008402 [Tephrocybe rancida]
MQLSPVKKRHLASFEPRTSQEQQLTGALLAKDAEIQLLKGQTMKVQATMVLQWLYCKEVRSQLKAKESKQKKKGEKGGRLHSDGLPRILTDDQFRDQVAEHQKAQVIAEVEKLAQQQAHKEREVALENWKCEEEERKKRNEERYDAWKAAEVQWEEDKKVVKANKGKLKDWIKENPKPKQNDPPYKAELAIPKPKVTNLIDEVLEDIIGRDEEDSEDSGDDD